MKTSLFVLSLVAAPMLAFGGEPPKQNHHCKMPDGTMDASKTHRQCKEAKGTWAKDGDEKAGGEKPAGEKAAGEKPAAEKPAATPAAPK